MYGTTRWMPFKLETMHCLNRGKLLRGCQMGSNVLHHRNMTKTGHLLWLKDKMQGASGPTEVEKNVSSQETSAQERWNRERSRSRGGMEHRSRQRKSKKLLYLRGKILLQEIRLTAMCPESLDCD